MKQLRIDMKIERWQRNLCFLWIAQTVSITGFSFAIPFAPLYLQDLGVTDPKQLRLLSGLFSSVAGLTMTIMTPFWGYLADRFGRFGVLPGGFRIWRRPAQHA